MPRALKPLVIIALVALLPLRAVAGVTIGFCASGHQDMAVAAHAAHVEHDEHAHHGQDVPASPVESSCNICAEHCSSAAIATLAEPAAAFRPVARDRTTFAERHAPAFVPDQFDRPPLA